MKKKLLMLSLALISCVCVAVGFSACGEETHTHDLTAYEAVAATCTEDGNIAYWYCSDCGKYFSDANGTTEISQADTVVSALGHDYETNFSWTETNGVWTATATRSCVKNDTEPETVNAVVTEKANSRTEADCTTAGSVTYIATATFSDNTNETEEKPVTIPATGHTYSDDWTTDGSAHWHAATCEHTTEVSDYAAHTFAVDEDGNYSCSVCGYVAGNYISSSSDKLGVGDNYLYLADEDAYLSGITFTVPEGYEGVFTFSISSASIAEVLIYDQNYDRISLSTTANSESVVATAGDTLYLQYVNIAEGETATDYIFCLTIAYEAAPYGSEKAPVSLSDSKEITVAAGDKYYFTVSGSSSLKQIYVSNSGLDLYQDGTKLTLTADSNNNYCYYIYTTYGTTYSYYLANDTGSSITGTVYYADYKPMLSEGTNSVTISKDMTTAYGSSAIYIRYYLPVTAGYVYTLTLGDGCDSNVAIKTGTYSATYLGYGSSNTEYKTGATYTTDTSFYIFYYGTEDSFNLVLNITSYVEDTTEDNSGVTADTLTLDTEVSCTVVDYTYYTVTSYHKIFLTYDATSTGVYTLSFACAYSRFASNITVTLDGETITGNDLDYSLNLTTTGTHTIEIKIAVSSFSYSVTATLVKGSLMYSGENTVTGISSTEANTYTFTAVNDGTYTFTVDSVSGDGSVSFALNSTDSKVDTGTDLTNVTSLAAEKDTFTVTLSEGDKLVFDCKGTASAVISIVQPIYMVDGGSTVSEFVEYTFTATAAGTYTFTVSAVTDGSIEYLMIYASEADYNLGYWYGTYYLDCSYGAYSFDKALAAGESLVLYGDNYSDGDFIITITYTKGVSLSAGETTISGGSEEANTYSFTAANAGTYTFTLTSVGDGTISFALNSTDTSVADGTDLTGITALTAADGTFTVTLAKGDKLVFDCTGTATAKLFVALSLSMAEGGTTVSENVEYTFTATVTGTYTFTISAVSGGYVGFAMLWESEADYNLGSWWGGQYYIDCYYDGYSFDIDLKAGESITVYTDNYGYGDFIITITCVEDTSNTNALSLTASNSVSAALTDCTTLTCYSYSAGVWSANSYGDKTATIYTIDVTSDEEGYYIATLVAAATNNEDSSIVVTFCDEYTSLDDIKNATRGDTAYLYNGIYLYVLATADCDNVSDSIGIYSGYTCYVLVYDDNATYDVAGTITFAADET